MDVEPGHGRTADGTLAHAGVLHAPTPDDDARVRALIEAELDRHHAMPVGRRTLVLLAEAGVEASAGQPGYRIVDRSGQTRLRPASEPDAKAVRGKNDKGRNDTGKGKKEKGTKDQGTKDQGGREKAARSASGPTPLLVPFTLEDLVAELREQHPSLFGAPPEPPPAAPEPAVAPPVRSRMQEDLARYNLVGTRFALGQVARARALTARSSARGRQLAAATSAAIQAWRTPATETTQTGERAVRPDAPPMRGVPSNPASPARPDWRARAVHAGTRLRADAQRLGPIVGNAIATARVRAADGFDARARRLTLAGIGLAAAAILAVVLVTGRTDETSQPDGASADAERNLPSVPPSPAAESSRSAANAPPADTASTIPDAASDPEEQPEETPLRRSSNETAGVPEVVNTATLRIAGKTLPLFGVEWVRGSQAQELTKYLARRPVSCRLAPGSRAYRCAVDGRDLSEVVLFNGGGRASPEAGPELVAAEDHARSERLGIWKR